SPVGPAAAHLLFFPDPTTPSSSLTSLAHTRLLSRPGSPSGISSHSPQPHPVRLSCPGSTRRPPPRPSDLRLPTTSVVPVRHHKPPLTRHGRIPSASVVLITHLESPLSHNSYTSSASDVPTRHFDSLLTRRSCDCLASQSYPVHP